MLSAVFPGPECSKNFSSTSGVIKSPGFPEKYPNNLDCTFMIFAPKMSEIVLEFESFEMEADVKPPAGVFCRYDRLEIWDGFPGGMWACSSHHSTQHNQSYHLWLIYSKFTFYSADAFIQSNRKEGQTVPEQLGVKGYDQGPNSETMQPSRYRHSILTH